MKPLLLAGDIGGTNTRLRLEQQEQGVLYEKDFSNQNYQNLVLVVNEFLQEAAENLRFPPVPQKACFAVAGPVDKNNNTCNMTNLGWNLDGNILEKDLEISHIKLINDFEAIGYGILSHLKNPERDVLKLDTLQEGKPRKDTPIGLIGVGTGLGEAFALRDDNFEEVYPTEGGHIDFAARSEEEFPLLKYIKTKYNLPRVSVERVVSGPGIVAIYQFLRDSKQYSESPDIADKIRAWEESGRELSKAPVEAIAQKANKKDEVCKKTMEIFVKAYGAEAGNLALKLLSYGGIYIAGGIAPEILKEGTSLRKSFMNEFLNKGRMSKLVEEIPVYLVKNKHIGLIGAAYYTATQMA
ncbi:MAG: glucokinase [Xenococcaceae cyanobacterium]